MAEISPDPPISLFDSALSEAVKAMEDDLSRFKATSTKSKSHSKATRMLGPVAEEAAVDDVGALNEPPPPPPTLRSKSSSYDDGQSYDGKSVDGARSRRAGRRRGSVSGEGGGGGQEVVWQFTGMMKAWDDYDEGSQQRIETAYREGLDSIVIRPLQKNFRGQVTDRPVEYKVLLNEKVSGGFRQQNLVTGFQRQGGCKCFAVIEPTPDRLTPTFSPAHQPQTSARLQLVRVIRPLASDPRHAVRRVQGELGDEAGLGQN